MRRERDAAGSLDQDHSNPQQRVKPSRKFSGTNQVSYMYTYVYVNIIQYFKMLTFIWAFAHKFTQKF
jgi:hypothetical protein